MTEEEQKTRKAQLREFPETMAALLRVREALAARVFKTPVSASKEREDLYTRVQALDAMLPEMMTVLNGATDDDAIEAYAKAVAGNE